jgi:histidinol-phosphate aminotransferase
MNRQWLRQTIRGFQPYKVPPLNEHIILNANESPYNIFDFPDVKEEIYRSLETVQPYHYPEPFADGVRAALAQYVGVQPEEVLAGNGGDEIIQLILNAFINPGDTVLVHSPTFDVYALDAQILGAKIVSVADGADFQRDAAGFLKKIKELQPKVTFICNPNNPTGSIWPTEIIEEMVAASPNPVVVDEAYLEFSGQDSIIARLPQHDNLVVIRTLSKAFGLAGIRLGYGVAQAEVINAISLTKAAYNLNRITQLIGEAVLHHADAILSHNVPPTIEAREYLIAGINALPGLHAYPSATNFILVRTPDVGRIVRALNDADIAVRAYGGREDLANCLRISVTTKQVAERVLQVIGKEVAGCAQC